MINQQKTEAPPEPQKVSVKPGEVIVIEYSEKALAVVGDTKPIKDKLKALGGKFNFRLKCGPGWIFPKSKLEALKQALGAVDPEPTSPLKVVKDEEPQHYDRLEDIEAAATSGKVISLCNLAELVNQK